MLENTQCFQRIEKKINMTGLYQTIQRVAKNKNKDVHRNETILSNRGHEMHFNFIPRATGSQLQAVSWAVA